MTRFRALVAYGLFAVSCSELSQCPQRDNGEQSLPYDEYGKPEPAASPPPPASSGEMRPL